MNIFSIDIIAMPLLYIPIVLLLMTALTIQLFMKTRRNNDLYLGIVLFITAIIAFLPFQWANGEPLLFWSSPFHIATIAVLVALGASLFFSKSLNKRQQWAYVLMLLLIMIGQPLSPTISGTIAGLSMSFYGVFLLVEIRKNSSREQVLTYTLLALSLLSFVGHWFPFNGGRFLYSICLVFLLSYEMIRFFGRVVLLLQMAGVNSMRDALTGLYNKGYLLKKSAQLISKQECGIIFADIDNFKILNDTKGHEHGDLVLQQVANLLQEVIGDNGIACRFGGEELVGIIEKGDPEEIASRFCRQVAKKTTVTVSVGVASGIGDSEELINLADERMYEAKRNGKNQVIFK